MSLEESIDHHREEFRQDLHLPRLVSIQPPTSTDPNTGQLHEEPAAAIGMSMSGSLLKRLGHPEGFGQTYPWMKALWLLRVECRRKHPHHRSAERPYWRGSLCHQAVKLVVIGGESEGTGPLSVENAGRILRVDRMEPLLLGAFRFIEETLEDFRAKAERRAREDAGLLDSAVRETVTAGHRRLPGLHEQDCPRCRAA